MSRSSLAFVVILCLFTAIDQAHAQRGGFGRDRGRGGDRGGDRGGSDRGRGGSEGDRSRSWGGDRGSSERGRSWGGDRGGSDRGRGGRPDFDPSQVGGRIAGYFDRNKDGHLDGGELERMPSSWKERFSTGGIDLSRGMSVADFGKRTGEAIRQRMEQRSREREGGDRERPDYERQDGSSKSSSGRSVFKQSPRQKFLKGLPEEYKEGDSDNDGQIALFEWAAWKRSDMFAFFELDGNQDGYLTARELSTDKSEADRGIIAKRDRLMVASGNSRGSRVRSGSSPGAKSGSGSQSPEEAAREKRRANYYFGALDRDSDGTISTEEWGRSRTVRGMFEKAGIKVGAMSESEFTSSYLKARAKSSSSSGGGEDRSRSWGGGPPGASSSSSRGRDWGGDRGSMGRGR